MGMYPRTTPQLSATGYLSRLDTVRITVFEYPGTAWEQRARSDGDLHGKGTVRMVDEPLG